MFHSKLVSVIIALLVLTTLACQNHVSESNIYKNQGVTGTVYFIPGYDGELAQNQLNPPERNPVPLADATVYLFRDTSRAVNHDRIVIHAVTDSLGQFALNAPPGIYLLGVGKESVDALGLVPSPEDASEPRLIVQAMAVIEVLPDTTVTRSLEIFGVIYQ